MTCERYRLLFNDWADGILPPQTCQTMAAHEAECPACSAYREDMSVLLHTLDRLDADLTPPEAFTTGWRRAVRKEIEARKGGRSTRIFRSLAAVAAILVCVVSVTALFQGGYLPGLQGFSGRQEDSQTGDLQAQFWEQHNEGAAPPMSAQPDLLYAKDLPQMSLAMDASDESASIAGGGQGFAASKMVAAPESGNDGNSDDDPTAKILRSGSFHLTSAQFDKDLSAILALSAEMGGWVEYQSLSGEPLSKNPDAGRYGSLNLRIPDQALDSFVTEIALIGKLQSSELVAEDISDRYHDQAARLANYESQRSRLQELYKDADNVSEILEIEARLSELQYQIDAATGSLKRWDSRQQFAQIHVSLSEVAERTQQRSDNPSLWSRIRIGLTDSLAAIGSFAQSALVYGVAALPWAVLGAGLVFVLLLLFRRLLGRRKET